MKRRLLNLLTGLSLLLCVAALVLWVRSYWRVDSLTFNFSPLRVAGVHSGKGSLCIELYGSPASDGQWGQFREEGHWESRAAERDPPWWEHGDRVALVLKCGQAAPFMDSQNGLFPFVVIPCWLPVLLLSLRPAYVVTTRRRAWRCAVGCFLVAQNESARRRSSCHG